jgi:DNA-binding GntR family transcriptional regulator
VAARLGITRQPLNRALAGLARTGWIQVSGAQADLREVAALQGFIES